MPKITNRSVIGLKFSHAYLVYDASANCYPASNPVVLTLVRQGSAAEGARHRSRSRHQM